MHPSRRAQIRKARRREERMETELGVDAEFLLTRSPIRADGVPESVGEMKLDWAPEFQDIGARPSWLFTPLLVAGAAFGLRLLPQWTGTNILYLIVLAFGAIVGLFEP